MDQDWIEKLKLLNIEVLPIESKPKLENPINIGCNVLSTEDPKLNDVCFCKTTKRGNKVWVSNIYCNESKIFECVVSTEIHPSFLKVFTPKVIEKYITTTFLDFCWLLSDGTTISSANECNTPIPNNCELGDLTWCLPSKFADDVIDVLGELNATIFGGALEDSFLFGPIV